jgi:hypothetical protein
MHTHRDAEVFRRSMSQSLLADSNTRTAHMPDTRMLRRDEECPTPARIRSLKRPILRGKNPPDLRIDRLPRHLAVTFFSATEHVNENETWFREI